MAAGNIRIGGASGFWGDSPEGARQLILSGEVDYVVFDYLAEITMSLLGRARAKDPAMGYAPDFIADVIKPFARVIAERKLKIISSAGGVNPIACKEAIERELAAADRIHHHRGRIRAVFDRKTKFEVHRYVAEQIALEPQEAELIVVQPGDIVRRADVDILVRQPLGEHRLHRPPDHRALGAIEQQFAFGIGANDAVLGIDQQYRNRQRGEHLAVLGGAIGGHHAAARLRHGA